LDKKKHTKARNEEERKMRKQAFFAFIIILMALSLVIMCGCGLSPGGGNPPAGGDAPGLKPIAKENVVVGFVYIGDIKDGGYNEGHDKGRLALEAEGIQCHYKENVPENSDCDTAIRELIDLGCNVIYTTSFGYMDFTLAAAKDFPGIYFGHATGYMTAENMCTYMGKVEQARYLTGIVAGMKTETNKLGYVMAMPYAECIRGCNAFTLGVRSVNPQATVEVLLVNSWNDVTAARQSAIELLNNGCDVIAQHHDATTPQIAAQDAGAFCVGYNVATPDVAPRAYLTSAMFNWSKFYLDNVHSIIGGTWKPNTYWEGLDAGWVAIDALSSLCPDGAQAKVDEMRQAIIDGTFNIFGGEIKDQNGNIKATDMTDKEVWDMEWFVEGVISNL
jgi:basic membrane protein A